MPPGFLGGICWAQDSRHSGIVYVVLWPLMLYLILRSVPG